MSGIVIGSTPAAIRQGSPKWFRMRLRIFGFCGGEGFGGVSVVGEAGLALSNEWLSAIPANSTEPVVLVAGFAAVVKTIDHAETINVAGPLS